VDAVFDELLSGVVTGHLMQVGASKATRGHGSGAVSAGTVGAMLAGLKARTYASLGDGANQDGS
jgi:hypothetical protein